MPPNREDLYMRIRAQGGRQARGELDATGRSVTRLGGSTRRASKDAVRAGGAFKVFGGGLGSMRLYASNAAAALGVLGLGGAVKTAITEFRESRRVGRDTAAAIKSMGAESWITAEGVSDLAEKISMKVGIDDEAIQKAQNLLLTFGAVRNEAGKGANMFDRATQAAVDLSARGFGSMESTAKQLGKALQDPIRGTTALSRSGVQFSTGQKKVIKWLVEHNRQLDAQKIIMREVEKQSAGSAAAQADAVQRMQVAWGNLMEKLGEQLWPVVEDVFNAFADLVDEMNRGVGTGGDLVDIFVKTWKIVKKLAPWIGALTLAYVIYRTAVILATAASAAFLLVNKVVEFMLLARGVRSLADAWILLNLVMSANVFALIVLGVIALGVALFVAYKKFKWFRDGVDAVWGVLKDVWGWVKSNWQLLGAILLAPFAPVFLAVKAIQALFGSLKQAWNKFAGFVNGLGGPVRGLLGKVGIHVPKVPTFDEGSESGSGSSSRPPRPPVVAARTSGSLSSGGGAAVFEATMPIQLAVDGKPIAKVTHRAAVKAKARK